MADDLLTPTTLGRRDFLRGSALFAAAIGLHSVPALAAGQQPPRPPARKEEPKPAPEEQPAEDDKATRDKKTLIDKDGRAYRVCPQCAYNMYKQRRLWVCENCGYSYVE
jgi:hypothetical protein